MLKINSIPNGLNLHVNNVLSNTKKLDIALKTKKEMEENISKVGKDNLLTEMRKINFDKVFSNLRKDKMFKKFNSKFDGKGKTIISTIFASLFTLVANPFTMIANATGNAISNVSIGFSPNLTSIIANASPVIEEAAKEVITNIDTKMFTIFGILHNIGGWVFIGFAIKEIVECMIKKQNQNIITVIIKYIIAFLTMLLMPQIFRWARVLVLGY